jgi:hypothetical protein
MVSFFLIERIRVCDLRDFGVTVLYFSSNSSLLSGEIEPWYSCLKKKKNNKNNDDDNNNDNDDNINNDIEIF